MSAAFEVLAWNDLAAALMEDFGSLTPRDRNLARKAFLGTEQPSERLYGISDDVHFRRSAVNELRTAITRYPTDETVRELVAELRDGSPEFARLWERHDVAVSPTLRKTFRNTAVGEVTVDCDSLKLVEVDQHLILYTAAPGTPDADKLALLAMIGHEKSDQHDRPAGTRSE